MSGLIARVGGTLLKGLKAGKTVAKGTVQQGRFTWGNLKGKPLVDRIKMTGTMSGRAARDTYWGQLTPAARKALVRTGYATGGVAAGGMLNRT